MSVFVSAFEQQKTMLIITDQYFVYLSMKIPFYKRIPHLLLVSVVTLVGCSREIEKVSDEELRAKWSECVDMNDPAPAMLFACENYKKECERRGKETGRYVC